VVAERDPDPRELLQVVSGGVLPIEDWESVYREHVVPVYRFVYARVGNRPDAEDITASVFERALPRLRTGATEGQMRGYLFATARSVLAEHWEHRFSVNELHEDTYGPVPEPVKEGDHDAEVEQVMSVLPPNYREVLELRFLRGYSLKETALAMGTSVGNVKVLQLRALRRASRDFAS
jgi:RNA polymerase sigma factor (sigma-70 family)